jgi:hypothetical protein
MSSRKLVRYGRDPDQRPSAFRRSCRLGGAANDRVEATTHLEGLLFAKMPRATGANQEIP